MNKNIVVSVLLSHFSLFYAADIQIPLVEIETPWGVSAIEGRRFTMEDRHTVVKSDEGQLFFGVYDGHGGKSAAEYVAEHLHAEVFKVGEKEGYLNVDDQFRGRSGTTVVTARIIPEEEGRKLVIAWAGDSRVLLVKQDGLVRFATTDHKPNDEKEKERIEKSGGYVSWARVNGALAVARAIGDNYRSFLGKNGEKIISAVPDICKIEITADDAFLILACDGVWDVISNEEAAQLVSRELQKEKGSKVEKEGSALSFEDGNDTACRLAAQMLRKTAFNKGSRDNITAMVVLLNKLNKASKKKKIEKSRDGKKDNSEYQVFEPRVPADLLYGYPGPIF
ncbi:MAG: PP2C family protein-serine/threonine phosphatase [Candidatus Dependentiae bacterium]